MRIGRNDAHPSVATAPLEQLREVRTGPLCSNYTPARDRLAFTVIYGPAHKELVLMADKEEDVCGVLI